MDSLLFFASEIDELFPFLEEIWGYIEEFTEWFESIGSSAAGIAGLLSVIVTIIGGIFSIFTAIVGAIGTVGAFILTAVTAIITFLFTLGIYLVKSIPLFIFALRAGCKYCWFAFIPYLRSYLQATLSQRKFNIFNLLKTNKRGLIALIYILIDIFQDTILNVLVAIPVVRELYVVFKFLLWLFFRLMEWRIMYDLFMTMKKDEMAMPLAVIGAIFSPVFYVAFLIMHRSEPEYGFKNFHEHSKEYAF